jgi:hypothetical protein
MGRREDTDHRSRPGTRSSFCEGRFALIPLGLAAVNVLCLPLAAQARNVWRSFVATAYTIGGTTAFGHPAVEGHSVAADPGVPPLGTRIEIRGTVLRNLPRARFRKCGEERLTPTWVAIAPPSDSAAEASRLEISKSCRPSLKGSPAPQCSSRGARPLSPVCGKLDSTGSLAGDRVVENALRRPLHQAVGRVDIILPKPRQKVSGLYCVSASARAYWAHRADGDAEDDLAILRNLRDAVRPGAWFWSKPHTGIFSPRFDRKGASRREGWRMGPWWSKNRRSIQSPDGAPQSGISKGRTARLLERAGLRSLSARRGCSTALFTGEGPDMGGRLAILTERPIG